MDKKKISEILLNLIVLILGISLFLWTEKVTNLVSMLLGCSAILYGLILLYNYFRNDERIAIDTLRFIYGIIILVIGFVLVFRVDFLKELISFVIGIYIVLSGILQLQEVFLIKKNTGDKLTNAIVLSLIEIFVGILCIVGKFIISDAIVKFISVMLIVYSILNIINLIIIRRK